MKQCYCLLERFNNYFNRKIIKYESLSDYEDHAKDSFIPLNEDGTMTSFDFNPADNVMTEIIVNNVPFDPDYFLLLDNNGNIVQRWFILEQRRNRQGQWIYQLRRDVVADNLNNLLHAPIFVQKGMLPDNDPMILNPEGMDFNQIKKSETLLKDMSKSSWIVCYLAKNLQASEIDVNIQMETEIPDYVELSTIASELGMSESILASCLNIEPGDNNSLTLTDELIINFSGYLGVMPSYNRNVHIKAKPDFSNTYDRTDGTGSLENAVLFQFYSGTYNDKLDYFEQLIRNNSSSLKNYMTTLLSRTYYLDGNSASAVLQRYNGSIILYLGNYYTLNISSAGQQTTNNVFTPVSHTIWNNICIDMSSGYPSSPYNSGEINLGLKETPYTLSLTPYTPYTHQYKLGISTSRKVCYDQEFDIVAIPTDVVFTTSGQDIVQMSDLTRRIASALALKEGARIYDVQLLPYCPRPEMIGSDNTIDLTDFNEHVDYDYIKETISGVDYNVGAVIYVENASFSNTINYSLTLSDSLKIENECNFYRLVSSNYQGSFEFNVAKNGGNVPYFNIYCTYRPYTPFIKVTPFLSNLYGEDFNDNRGLICGGDFSLPRATSAWQQYELENKNYQNIFNREIQNMTFLQSIEMRNQRISGAVGIISDTAKGAGAGAYVGGGIGAIVGGAIGGITSAIGYNIDTDTLAKTQRETKQLAIDKFNYQLGNVKALPYTLTKVGAFDISSKVFPFLEYYTCTDKEKDALRNKILYESMTVMRIGTLNEFMNFNNQKNYFKGELIRNDEIADDPHTLNAVYEELLKGVYI